MSLSSRRRVANRLPLPRRRSVLENLESRTLLHGGAGFEAHVNFQPASSVVPAGYLADAQPSGRALLLPASSFGTYIWGSTSDEPRTASSDSMSSGSASTTGPGRPEIAVA